MLNERPLFQIPESQCYFNAAFLSPQLKHLTALGGEALKAKESPWLASPPQFFDTCEMLRESVGRLWGCSKENIALIPAVSYGAETAVRNLPLKPGQTVVVPAGDFPSNIYPWQKAAKRADAALCWVERAPNEDWTEAICQAIDEKTAVVSVPQSDWSNGVRFDLSAISAKAKQFGAALVVDVSQSFGAVPFSIADFDPDFLFSVGYKWQLGPYGVSFMYVADRQLQGEPLENGWLNRKGCEDFTRLTEYQEEYLPGARRFDSGQHSQFVLNEMAVMAMDYLGQVGIANIFQHIQTLSEPLRYGLKELGFSLPEPKTLVGHITGASHSEIGDLSIVAGRLRERHVTVSVRGRCMRISPHVYNTLEDVEYFLKALRASL